ncbi:MAG TPA: cytochrome c oxidase assembly protein [Actinomycetota bacterium]|nr:cytochrome c oxidase assembly protein [Actinomycetota bacterium]
MLRLAHGLQGGSPWEFHPHLDVWLVLGAVAIAYVVALKRWMGPAERAEATQVQKLSFFAGLAIMWIAADWPIHDISENYLFSVHMVQHTLFSLVAPPLILLGIPAPLLRKLLRPVMGAVRFFTRPLIALALFNLVMVITHWPPVVNTSVTVAPAHLGLHLLLVFSSLVMWWVVVSPLPELPSLSPPGKMLFLFGQSILPTVPASFLTFASSPLYEAYANAPRLWGISAVTDQMVAGLIMKIGGGLLLWSVIALLFFKWYASEQKNPPDEIAWEDFERELQVWDLRR